LTTATTAKALVSVAKYLFSGTGGWQLKRTATGRIFSLLRTALH